MYPKPASVRKKNKFKIKAPSLNFLFSEQLFEWRPKEFKAALRVKKWQTEQ